MAKTALVTGGAGFIGSHLCERLLKLGYYVVCLDDLSSGSEANLTALRGEPRFRFVCQSVEKPVLAGTHPPPDVIFNLACPASPVQYQRDPLRTLRTCVMGAFSVLELARETGAIVVQASTSEVYGDPAVSPQPETYVGAVNPIGPRACYDEGKRAAETVFFDHHRRHGTRIKVARIFNTYGPNMRADDGRVISNFIVQALRDEPLTIYGDGSQTRSFCYVTDLVEGLMRLSAAPDNVTGPINLGRPGEITMRTLAELIIELTASRSSVTYLPLPADDPRQRLPDVELAKRELGWFASTPLSLGLINTVKYFKKVLSA